MITARKVLLPLCLSLLGACGAEVAVPTNDVADLGSPDGAADAVTCASEVDSDHDGLSDGAECALGTQPLVADSDGDGVLDGVEARYGKLCIAQDPARQRRPGVACTEDAACAAGERCLGLDPLRRDSDGDGVPDGQEDRAFDGQIDLSLGETDPRLADSAGDGLGDGARGLEICQPAGLGPVTRAAVPSGASQLAFDPAWGAARAFAGTPGRGALIFDDVAAGVAGAVLSGPAATLDVRAEAVRLEGLVTSAIGAGVTPVLTGQALVTHEQQPAVASVYRVARSSTASALRDLLPPALVGAAAPAGAPVGAAAEFLLDVTTVLRPGQRSDVIVTIAPRAASEDGGLVTAIRAADLSNATGLADGDKTLGSTCQTFKAERAPMVDFLWTVDTSGSMDDDQARLGNTAAKFFQHLRTAGVDFRVAVLQAGSVAPNLDSPGLSFVSGADPLGPLSLCQQVTTGTCPTGGAETLRPYAMSGGQEEPVAAAVLAHDLLRRRQQQGEANGNRRFRDGARVVAFMVTDEPTSQSGSEANDFSRYFKTASDPQSGKAWGPTYDAASLGRIVDYFKRNDILTFGLVPVYPRPCLPTPDPRDLPRCVIEGNGGATIPIATALDSEVTAAMNKIVDAVAGATSQFRLQRTPVTSTLKVRVRGVEVPRSRSEGFDYNPAAHSIVFYGSRYRPAQGDEVVVSYRVWDGSLG